MPDFLQTSPLYQLSDVRRNKAMLPTDRGVYGFYFGMAPGIAPIDGAFCRGKLSLLYIGTAGADRARRGTLRNRLGQNHLGGNERRSTICLTLASLLPDVAGPSVLRIEKGKAKFHTSPQGAARLRNWMDENIYACWITDPRPAEAEQDLVKSYRTPLNIDFSTHPFAPTLSELRNNRRAAARALTA
ncbi:GIY-YIG nuclease family protein [Qipengyuania profunda]|jgi:hypothetical protein|uniref:GIY-YIG nuclease family protein n=1 Tax=Qipengyuania profunda TaxID=3113984 RepID=UPI002A18DB4C|nr:hypothetical protein [Qipengyuania sp. HL-TH1]WPL57406.1 hypothetical protein SD421_02965 [Qipengyuania sp. HL-TH5]